MREFGALVASITAVLCLTVNPAHASIAADFNGDGVLDEVVLPRPPETNIVIHISGSTPQILKFSGRVISVVAADVDHDGDLDLSALSDRRGLLVWLNKAGHGRFTALKKKHRAPRGFALSRRAQTSATQPGDDAPAASNGQCGVPDADAPRAGPVFEPPRGSDILPGFPSRSSASVGDSTPLRGPPSLAVD